jgi:cell division protein FtsI/penicillin-binding protein 2/N-acetylmuramoyl-L-alanine amidase
MNSILSAVSFSARLDYLGHVALKGTGLMVVALLAGLALRRLSAARRYVLWFSTVLAVGALTIAAPLLPAWRVLPAREVPDVVLPPSELEEASAVIEDPLPVQAAAPVLPPVVMSEPVPMPLQEFRWPTISWSDVVTSLPLVWLLVASALSIRLVISGVRLSLLRRRCAAREVPLELNRALVALVAEYGRATPRLLVGPAGSVPMVWGILRPCLLLPADADDWPEEKLRAVLLHELAHLRRRDPAALLIAQIAQALHWFNPLAWLTVRSLRADQERACDDAVLRHGIKASDYAQHLLDISQHQRLAPGLGLCALAMARSAPVEKRLAAILDSRIRREATSRGAFVVSLLVASVIAMPLAMLANEAAKGLRGRILDRHGVVLAESTKEKVRHYPLKTLAAHVVGYASHDRGQGKWIGRAGMEGQCDSVLASGTDTKLTLDVRVQAIVERAMMDAGVGRGATVILDPRSGDILAMASVPNFSPGKFAAPISLEDWDAVYKNEASPLLNRAVRSYAPGAAYLPFTALAGVSVGIGDSRFNCTGSVIYGDRQMKCWISNKGGQHGVLDLQHALQASCNCYWYQYGNQAGDDAFTKVGHKIGLGEKYGLLDNESAGVLTGKNELSQRRPELRWAPGSVANASIGAGLVEATPLQLAVLAATIGNAGQAPGPRLVAPSSPAKWRADLVRDGLDPKGIERIGKGMWMTVNEEGGSGGKARSTVTQIAGRTGTAQFLRKGVVDNHCWFIGFAPFEKPTLAFAVLVQGGKSGGGVCAPIAKRIVEETLALPADGSGKDDPVEEQAGHFNPINSTAEALGKTESLSAGGVSGSAVGPRHPLLPQKRDLIEEARRASTKDEHGVSQVFPIDKGRYVEQDPVQEKIKSMNPSPSDEVPKILTPNNDDAEFFKSFQSEPRRFTVRLSRSHYFGDDVPNLEGRDCFEVVLVNDPKVHHAFVLKSSPLAKELTDRVTWASSQESPFTVELQWSKLGDKEWIDLISLEGGPLADERKGTLKPNKAAIPPGTMPNAPSANWKLIQIDGRDHVSLENVKSFYRLSSLDRSEDTISLRTANMLIETRVGNRELIINGVKYILSLPITEGGDQSCISRQDLVTILEPVLRPSEIKDAVDFDTVVIDPGHGGADEGAKGSIGLEKTFTLELGMELKKELISRGIKVVMTRDSDSFVPSFRRVAIANQTPNSIVLSLHFNSGAADADGIETFTLTSEEGTPTSLTYRNIALATAIHAKVKSQFKLNDRGIKSAQWTVLTGLKQPGILFEGGFVTHESEGRLIASDTYRKALAGTMADGVLNYRMALSRLIQARDSKSDSPVDGTNKAKDAPIGSGNDEVGRDNSVPAAPAESALPTKERQSSIQMQRSIMHSAARVANESESPLQSSPYVMRVWRVVQRNHDLPELPQGTTKMESDFEGSGYPRDTIIRFTAPQFAARVWLARCSIEVDPDVIEEPIGPVAKLLESTPLAVMRGSPQSSGLSRLMKDWPMEPSTGYKGSYLVSPNAGSCVISVSAPDVETVRVEILCRRSSVAL